MEIKHIMLPPSPREFKDIYVVFELMETDLHQVSVNTASSRWRSGCLCGCAAVTGTAAARLWQIHVTRHVHDAQSNAAGR